MRGTTCCRYTHQTFDEGSRKEYARAESAGASASSISSRMPVSFKGGFRIHHCHKSGSAPPRDRSARCARASGTSDTVVPSSLSGRLPLKVISGDQPADHVASSSLCSFRLPNESGLYRISTRGETYRDELPDLSWPVLAPTVGKSPVHCRLFFSPGSSLCPLRTANR